MNYSEMNKWQLEDKRQELYDLWQDIDDLRCDRELTDEEWDKLEYYREEYSKVQKALDNLKRIERTRPVHSVFNSVKGFNYCL